MQPALADPESGLGGRLFYAGELDDEGRALVVAANIAGAATLVATADRAAQKQAIRDGVADFLVNSLDEALRILKNQLRKRETVAVCVGLAPEAVEREMKERGVLPDLLRRDVHIAPYHDALMLQEGEPEEIDFKKAPALVTWSVASDSGTVVAASWTQSLSIVSTQTRGRPAAGCAWLRATSAAWRRACACSTATANSPPAFPSKCGSEWIAARFAVAFEIRSHYSRPAGQLLV